MLSLSQTDGARIGMFSMCENSSIVEEHSCDLNCEHWVYGGWCRLTLSVTSSNSKYKNCHWHYKVQYMVFSHQCPPGMKQQVLTFYTKLLAHIRQPLLPHINVHRPVQVRSATVWIS